MSTRQRTPELVTTLAENERFVFGSNGDGAHAAGAALAAHRHFGAVWGVGHGPTGRSYAIDTMSGPEALAEDVAAFLEYARQHPDLTFLLTPVGCGIAGLTPAEVAPLFAGAPDNVAFPESFEEFDE
jgi:hypothetical protein